ncbi:hypothetical protein F4808DRAFT_434687 [Astrocystis sublimbata]|nr:hypothetical protein F4808DRAFT_434687 [Astrocystis sublimbata]
MISTRGFTRNSTMATPASSSLSPSGTTNVGSLPTNAEDRDKTISTPASSTAPAATSSASYLGPPWQGGSAGGARGGQNSWRWGPWGNTPTTIVTLTTTVDASQSSTTEVTSQTPLPNDMGSGDRKGGMDISGPVAAGIGAGVSIGLLGIGVVVYLCIKRLRRRGNRSVKAEGESEDGNRTSDEFWPPYDYSASNEIPVELPATRQPQEMCAETKPLEKDSSSRSFGEQESL